jgi:hypothetical protein
MANKKVYIIYYSVGTASRSDFDDTALNNPCNLRIADLRACGEACTCPEGGS